MGAEVIATPASSGECELRQHGFLEHIALDEEHRVAMRVDEREVFLVLRESEDVADSGLPSGVGVRQPVEEIRARSNRIG
jgi:hypothetical protein